MKKLFIILVVLMVAAVTGCSNNNNSINMENENNVLEHYTILADGIAGELTDGFSCRPGKAVMGIKVWSPSIDEAGDMAESIGNQIGFKVQGKVEIYKTKPNEEAGDNPHGYDIMFTPHD